MSDHNIVPSPIPTKEILVFGGGGSRAILYIGIFRRLQELVDTGKLVLNIREILGVSAGSIFGLLYILGYTADELEKIVFDLVFKTLRDINFNNFFTHYGIDSGHKIVKLLGNLIEAKGLSSQVTFQQLQSLKRINLKVAVSDLTRYQLVVFDAGTFPDTPVLKAIRMSIGIPLYFWAEWHNGICGVDGGLVDSYPIKLYSDSDSGSGSNGEQFDKILGFKIVNHQKNNSGNGNVKIKGIDSFLTHVFYCLMVNREQDHLNYNDYTVCINLQGEDLLNFDMNLIDKKRLITAGEKWSLPC